MSFLYLCRLEHEMLTQSIFSPMELSECRNYSGLKTTLEARDVWKLGMKLAILHMPEWLCRMNELVFGMGAIWGSGYIILKEYLGPQNKGIPFVTLPETWNWTISRLFRHTSNVVTGMTHSIWSHWASDFVHSSSWWSPPQRGMLYPHPTCSFYKTSGFLL